MRTKISTAIVAAALAASLLAAPAPAGPLTPPPGTPAPTNKTLSDLEPRIALSAANTPGDADHVFIIDEPGSYYLTENLVVPAGMSGVRLETNFINLDLNGFTINGSFTNAVSGIIIDTSDATIANGTVESFSAAGITTASNRSNITIRDMLVRNTGADGIFISGSVAVVERVTVLLPGGNGITCNGRSAYVVDCYVSNAGGSGIFTDDESIITRNRVSASAGANIRAGNASLVYENNVTGGSTGIESAALSYIYNNSIRFAADNGIFVQANAYVRNNSVLQSLNGIRASNSHNFIDSNFVFACDTGIDASNSTNTVVRNTSINNFTADYDLGSALRGPIITGSGLILSEHPWANFGS